MIETYYNNFIRFSKIVMNKPTIKVFKILFKSIVSNVTDNSLTQNCVQFLSVYNETSIS